VSSERYAWAFPASAYAPSRAIFELHSKFVSIHADSASQFTDYTETIMPHLLSYPDPPAKYMRTLLQRLDRFNLTKPEVLVMINLGVGVKKPPGPGQIAVEVQDEDGVETVENGVGDLLDKVEMHINSAEGPDGTQVGQGHASNEDIQMDNGQVDSSDISVSNNIIEEMYERFNDADINEILQICGEVLGRDGTANDEVDRQG